MNESLITLFVAKVGVKPRGVGKTLLMTDVNYKDYKYNGKKIISNYHLNFPHIYKSYREIIDFPDDLYDANVLLDEILIGANSRKFMSKDNNKLIEFLTQIRKRNCDVFITAQTARQIDSGVREQIDIIVEMEKYKKDVKDKDGIVIGKKEVPLFFDVVVRDRHNWDVKTNILNEFIYDGRKFASMKLYDTNEVITKDGSKESVDPNIDASIEVKKEVESEVLIEDG